MSDFNDDFDNFDDDNFEDFNEQSSLKDTINNNPLLKIFGIIALIVLVVVAVFIFGGSSDEKESRLGNVVDKRETLGGEVSEVYAGAIDDVNRQRRENAVRQGTSSIDMIVNAEQQELLTVEDELPTFEDFDPLQTFRAAIAPQEREPATNLLDEEPILVSPEDVFLPNVGQQPQIGANSQQVPAPSPEAIQALAQAMSAYASTILSNHTPVAGQITQVTPENFFDPIVADEASFQNENSSFDTSAVDAFAQQTTTEEVTQNILIPSGTINYAQILIEANSDVPGPVLAQLVSGPLSGARLIGSFTVQNKLLALTFDSIIIDGINQSVSAIALDPNTTIAGVATDVNNRYFARVLLPAAARFLEGVGSAIAQDTETTVTVSGDTVIEDTAALDFEQELGRGVESGFEEIAEFLDDEADDAEILVRVQRGTPVGIFFTEPVIESQ